MAPEQTSPYWGRIVGNNWPQIPPSAWHDLETAARDGAEALSVADLELARQRFDEVVRHSEGLAQIRRALVALEEYPRAFAAALSAAADTYGTFGEIVRRTRNQILDVVDNAEDRIANATRGDNNDDGEEDDEAEAEADRQATEAIVNEARRDVVDIVDAALSSLGPQGLPRLDDIAAALGQPGPWRTGGQLPDVPRRRPGGHDGPGRHDRPGRRRAPGYEHGPWVPGFERPVLPNPALGQILIDLLDDLLRPGADPVGAPPPSSDIRLPVGTGEIPGGPAVSGPAGSGPVAVAPGHGAPGHGAPGYMPTGQRMEPGAPEVDVPADSGNTGGAEPVTVDASPDAPAAEGTGSSDAATEPDREVAVREEDGPSDAWGALRAAGTHSAQDAGESSGPAAAPPVFPAAMASAAGATAAPAVTATTGAGTGAPATSNSAPAGNAGSTAPGAVSSAQAGRGAAPSVEAHRAPGSTGKALSSGSAATSSASPGKLPVPIPDGDAATGKSAGPGEFVHSAVGAAMLSASAPSFVVGERVDGDLILARTLLGGIRTATDSWVVGVDWAVAVLRHPSGVSAFVTSNEGRGWLPARLHLPSEVSLPWLWAVAEGAAWEGVADPARVLVEFAIAWGAKSGAKLSALASSQPIDPLLGGQLGTVALAGSVPPSATMDLRSPAPGTLDRLGVTAAPGLLDRAAKVADNDMAVRCLELAVDAHTRVSRADFPTVDTMDAPAIRLRILRALRDGRNFADSWWEEIQDADDLIAATVLGHRADTGRIGLGELRTDAADFDPGSELSLLRTLTFQRRCNELVLLLAEERSRQTLRDAVYAHAQVLGHPLFAPPQAAPAPRRATVSTASIR